MRPRSIVALAFVVAAIVGPAAGAAQAAPATSPKSAAVAGAKITKPAKPAKPAKVPFTTNGSVSAVDLDARTVTVVTTGGMRDLRGRSVTVAVPVGAKIVVNEVRASLDAVEAGFRITVVGVRAGDALTATKISATAPVVVAP